MAAGHLADHRNQAVVDLVSDDQESEHGSPVARTAIYGLNEGLVEVMLSEPPVAGIIGLFQRLLEILFGVLPGEASCFGVECEYLARLVEEGEKIVIGDIGNVLRSVFYRGRVRDAHDVARDRQIGEQSNVPGEHGLAFAAVILKRSDGVLQVYGNVLTDVLLDSPAHQQQTGHSQARRNEQHGQEEARSQPQSRHENPGRIAIEEMLHGKSASNSAHELIPHSVHGAEVYRTGRILFQFLTKLKNMVVHGPSGGVILVAPDFIQ